MAIFQKYQSELFAVADQKTRRQGRSPHGLLIGLERDDVINKENPDYRPTGEPEMKVNHYISA